ncbi:magnesium transporter NIPA-domain-containing protein [Podospora australis]|uniref:Magnesium transporter NIPA-domain-containing protein n=1 Tax=Podospora australis TaxID=1536484 RepID=A0AAN6WXG4_9PEZI|nr:magnesium transporter NIPA-domain-containing protein [Podospora australis]
MDRAAQALDHAHQLYARAGGGGTPSTDRPPVYKAIGIGLAIGSGAFIGTSFVLKKVGLLRANEKYNEVAGEGYGYLKNFYWWAGMTLMILGEGLNFAAYAFTDAILVTPLGALSVVITTILSAIFLKERLSMVGKVACFLCIVGSIVIVMNAPKTSAVNNIQEMKDFVIHPLFLSYAGVVIVGSIIIAFWLGPKYGKTNMMVYISICSWVGGLSVVATQGLGAAIIAQAGGQAQFNQWFLYVLLVFVIGTLLTEIIFLNKALNLFNAALVTPTYYVYFTSTTIITSAILFRGFKGTPSSIITVVNGFLTICAGVVLLQLSKSAKDVPDTAVFAGDLDQIQTIAEQPQPETEPKADAIRGTAAIVRRLSNLRQKMEMEELKRLHEEKMQESLAPVSETGAPVYEWDGLRRRRTGTFSSSRTRPGTSGGPPFLPVPQPHPPLGWSHFPTEEELAEANRPVSPALSSLMGTIRTRARSVLLPGHPQFGDASPGPNTTVQSPLQPVQLTSVSVPGQEPSDRPSDAYLKPYYTPRNVRAGTVGSATSATSSKLRVQFNADGSGSNEANPQDVAPTPPPHSARRQFSFQNIFRRHQAHTDSIDGAIEGANQLRPHSRLGVSSRGYSSPQVAGATEEETLGLVKGDSRNSRSTPVLPRYDDDDDDDEVPFTDDKKLSARYGHSITQAYQQVPRNSPPRAKDLEKDELAEYEARRQRFGKRTETNESSSSEGSSGGESEKPAPPPPPPPQKDPFSEKRRRRKEENSKKGGPGGGSFLN